MGDVHLLADLGDGVDGVVFDGTDADLGAEDGDQEAVFVHVTDEDAIGFPLLVHVTEGGFLDEAGDALGGGVGGGGEGAEGGGVTALHVSAFADDEAAFIENEGGGGFTFGEEIIQGGLHDPDILLDQLGKGGHGLGGISWSAGCFR
ncbi:MAG: hypothetical protein RI897_2504 [Verrucomicrobiota bacterium]